MSFLLEVGDMLPLGERRLVRIRDRVRVRVRIRAGARARARDTVRVRVRLRVRVRVGVGGASPREHSRRSFRSPPAQNSITMTAEQPPRSSRWRKTSSNRTTAGCRSR